MTTEEFEHMLNCWLEGLSPLEKVLAVASVLREVYPEYEWLVSAKADGSFKIERKIK